MTAVVENQDQLCIVHRIGREGLSVKIDTYCRVKLSASSVKVVQVPDAALAHPKVCGACKQGVAGVVAALKQ